MSKHASTRLSVAAQILGSHPAGLRKTINRFQIVERDGQQRTIPNEVLALFRRTKATSGYLVPYWIRTRDEVLAAAKIPASEMADLADGRHDRDDVGQAHHVRDVDRHRHRGGGDA